MKNSRIIANEFYVTCKLSFATVQKSRSALTYSGAGVSFADVTNQVLLGCPRTSSATRPLHGPQVASPQMHGPRESSIGWD